MSYSTDEDELDLEINKPIPLKKKIKPVKLFADKEDDNEFIIKNNNEFIINNNYNNNNNNINNINNNNYINNINNYNNKINNENNLINKKIKNNDKVDEAASEIDKFIGLYEDDPKYKNRPKASLWKFCDYCEKRHGVEYFYDKSNYCVLCWSWLNAAEIDLESGEYLGVIDYKIVKDMLVKTYPLFIKSNHSNPNSIYHKINSFKEAGILHESFRRLLGFETEKLKIQEFIINSKERKLNINYEKTVLHI
jgi:hypothetical protein